MPEKELNPLVSVIIPCYNGASFIEETIQSVLNQTYRNLELLVVDDGSTDNSAELIKKLAMQDSRVIYLHQKNAGVSNARNTGIKHAKGDILSFLDADDWMYPENIGEKVNCLVEHDSDMVFSWTEVTDQELNQKYFFKGADALNFENEIFQFAPPPVPSPSSVIAKKKSVIEAGMFDPNLSISADLDLWIRLSFGHKVTKVEKPLIKYRLVDGSMNTNIKGQINDVDYIIKKYSGMPEMKPKLRKFKKGFYYSIAGNALYTKNFKQFVQFVMKYLGTVFSEKISR